MGEKWMEEVANAGGFEEHAKIKAQQELMERMDKMPPEKFLRLKDMLGSLEHMLDTGGSDLGILGGLKDSITDTIKTEFNAVTAEFKNSLNTIINTALEPFLPMIQTALNGIATLISRGMGAIEALITGKFDQYIRNLKLEMQDQVNEFQVGWSEFWVNFGLQFDPEQYLLHKQLSAQGTAGGLYSGQFEGDYSNITINLGVMDLSPEAIAARLLDLGIPIYEEGE